MLSRWRAGHEPLALVALGPPVGQQIEAAAAGLQAPWQAPGERWAALLLVLLPGGPATEEVDLSLVGQRLVERDSLLAGPVPAGWGRR